MTVNGFTDNKMNLSTYRPCNIHLLQRSHLRRSSEEMNETTLPTLQIQDELSTPIQRYPHLPLLRTPMAQDDFNYDGKYRNKLTRKQTGCRVLQMIPRISNITAFLGSAPYPLRGIYAYRGVFMTDCHQAHTVSILRYLTLTHKECSYRLSEVLKLAVTAVWGPLWS